MIDINPVAVEHAGKGIRQASIHGMAFYHLVKKMDREKVFRS